MDARVVDPKGFAAMLGISDKTASLHMRRQPECLNVGTGRYQHLRLPLAVAEEIAAGIRPLSPVEKPVQARAKVPGKTTRKNQQKTRYVAYR